MVINVDALTNGVNFREFGSRLPRIPVASAISGLIVAALILMTPNPWFESFVTQTGLPDMISAAEPPLGARARIVFALIAALIVTGGAWLALSLILGESAGRRNVPPFVSVDEDEDARQPFDFLRRRRADSHPDAPPRRPIFAADDLGAPLDLVDVVPEEEPLAETDEPVEEADPAYQLSHEDFAAERAFADGDAPAAEPLFTMPLRSDRDEDRTVLESSPAEDSVSVEEVLPASDHWSAPAPGFEVRTELAQLVGRLEAGLERRRARLDRQRPVEAGPAASSGGERNIDGALREALDALQKLEARGA